MNTLNTSDDRHIFKDIMSRLEPFAALEDGWDGEDSFAPSTAMLGLAVRCATKIASANIDAPHFMIFHDGQLGVYWKTDRLYLSITFEDDGEYPWTVAIGDEISSSIWNSNDPLPVEIVNHLQYQDQNPLPQTTQSFRCYDSEQLKQLQANQIQAHPIRYRWLNFKWKVGFKGVPCQCGFHEISHFDMDKEFDLEDYPCTTYRSKTMTV